MRIGGRRNSPAGRLLGSLLVDKRPCLPTRPSKPAVSEGRNRLARHGACAAVCAAVLAMWSTTWECAKVET
eukprot:356454-Chlamydomonas_euryale.AAC.9